MVSKSVERIKHECTNATNDRQREKDHDTKKCIAIGGMACA